MNMNKGTAKAFLATVMVTIIVVLAFSMFHNQPITHLTYAASSSDPPLIPEPEEQDTTTPDLPATGSTIRAGSSSSGKQTPNPSQTYKKVATFDGYWGSVFVLSAQKRLHRISDLQGNVYAKGTTNSGEFIDPYLQIQGTYQGKAIYIKLPIDSSSYNGIISFQSDFSQQDSISGSYWDDTDRIQPVYQRTISFFTWNSNQYWIYGRYKATESQAPSNQQQPPFVGYWGKLSNAQPIGALEGQVLSVAVSATGQYTLPWLYLKTAHPITTQVSIRYPITNPVSTFQGKIIFYEQGNEIESKIITGTQSHVSGGTGFCGAFFNYNGEQYWILGIGTGLP